MIQPHASESASERSASTPGVKKSVGMIVLLSYLTLSNTFALVLGIIGWADWSDHGSRFDDMELRAMVFTTFASVIALIALGGAWATQLWGPRVYVAVAGLSLLIGLVITEGAGFSALSLIGVAIAVGLWLNAEANW
ncbi:MAG TPA: hypothetical protein VNO31_45605 [Umezawaea sp.]|nr:hypothetical protein [Umezawaea sp.]